MRQCIFVGLLLWTTSAVAAETTQWPQFRGPRADGIAEGATLPDSWSEKENVVWKASPPGWGWSSPVVWDDKIFITAAVSEKEREKLVVGGYPGGRVKPDEVHRWLVSCYDFETGKLVWKQQVHEGIPPEERHPKNSYANSTPVTDGEHVYAYLDNIGMFCFDFSGQQVWKKEWGAFPIRGGWGPGSSPVLHKDRLYFVNDNEKSSFITALDKRTGEEIWRVPREEKSNWSTPYIWEHERTEIVTIGTNKIRSYDLQGQVLWELSGTSGLVSQTPFAHDGLLYVGAGYHYGPLYAIRPGASGDISLKTGESQNDWIVWSQPRASSIHPGYLISDDRLFVLYDSGLLACLHAKTGETIFSKKRLDTGGGRFYASPWRYNGKIFLLNENGTTWVVDDAPEFQVIRKNVLNDYAWATPAIARGSLIIRTYAGLFRFQTPSGTAASK